MHPVRSTLPVLALLLFWTAGCGGSPAGWLREPPLPEALAELDGNVRTRIEEAAARVRQAPEPVEAWGELGKLYEAVGLRLQAIACYEQAQLRVPGDPKWWYRSGVCRGRMQDMGGAIRDMQRVIELEPSYAPAYYRRGACALDDGDLELAQESFRAATRVTPEFMGGWVGLARVHLLRDENEEALALLEAQAARDPKDPVVTKLLRSAQVQAGIEPGAAVEAAAAQEEGDLPAGVFWLDPWQVELAAYRLEPESHRISRMIGRGEADLVIAQLEERRRAEPRETEFLPQLAEAYFQVGRGQEARETYRALLELEPDNIPARLGLARFQEASGFPHLAIEWLDQILAIDPSFGPAWAAKGSILVRGEQYEQALPVLRRAVELDQRIPQVWVDLGNAQMLTKDWAAAITSFENYLAEVPDDPEARISLARVLAKNDELDRAEAELERARALEHDRDGRIEEVERLIERGRARREKRKDV